MKAHRREFLRKISSVAVLAGIGSVSQAGCGSSLDSQFTSHRNVPRLRAWSPARSIPVLSEQVNGHRLVYLDSAATTQRPRAVIDALAKFYLHDNANPAKSLHTLARRSATLYEKARETLQNLYMHADPMKLSGLADYGSHTWTQVRFLTLQYLDSSLKTKK